MTQRGGLVSHWSHKPIKAVRIRPSATLRKILFIRREIIMFTTTTNTKRCDKRQNWCIVSVCNNGGHDNTNF